MKTVLADFGETYKRSNIPQLKALFSSMLDTEERATIEHWRDVQKEMIEKYGRDMRVE